MRRKRLRIALVVSVQAGVLACGVVEPLPPPPYLTFEPQDLTTNLGSPSSCNPRFSNCASNAQLGSGIGIWISNNPVLTDAEIAELQQSLSLAYWPDGGAVQSTPSGLIATDFGSSVMRVRPAESLRPDAWIAIVFDSKLDIPVAFTACALAIGADGGPHASRFRVGSYPLLLGAEFGVGDAIVTFSESMATGTSPPASYTLADPLGACTRPAQGYGWDDPIDWDDQWECPGDVTSVTVQVSAPVIAASGLAVRRFDGGDLPTSITFDADASVPVCDFSRF